jgi:lipopolysaccharide transport system permease protein/teichoic acid transport system permease protein
MLSDANVWTNSPSLWGSLRQLFARRETIRYLVSSNLKAGHRNKALGNLWNLLDPLLSLAVYFLVFGLLFQQAQGRTGDYLTYLFVGVLAWRFLDGTISQAVNCIRGNRGIIGEINFPKAVFPLSISLSRLYDFVWGLVVLFAAMLITRREITWHAAWMLPLALVELLLVTGLAYIAAYLGAFFADTANISHVALRLAFYASPILYYIHGAHTRVPEKYLSLYMLNPMACLLEGYHDALVGHQSPDPHYALYLVGVTLVLLVLGYGIFSRGEGKFAKYV